MLHYVWRYWFADRGIGVPSRARTVWHVATLGPIRYRFGRIVRSLFLCETPIWAMDNTPPTASNEIRSSWISWINPIRWFVWTLGFIFEWIVSRRYYSYGPAIPGVIAVTGFAYVHFASSHHQDGWRDAAYRRTLRESTSSEDHRNAIIAIGRLIERHPDSVELRLQHALILESGDKIDEARTEMERLVVEHRSELAAYWLVRRDYQIAEVDKWNENKHKAFRFLISICANKSNESVFVATRVLLSQYLVGVGALKEAILQMEAVAGANCELQLVCSALQHQAGNDSKSAEWAARSADGLRGLLLADPANIDLRLKLAKALMLRDQPEAVATILSEGYKLTKDERLLQAGAESLVAWSQRLEKQKDQSPSVQAKRLTLLLRAAELAPKNTIVLETLANAVIQFAGSRDPQIIKLRDSLFQKLDVEKAHFVRGTVALLRGDLTLADKYLELAQADSINVPGVLNNLAVVLYQQETPDLDRALTLVNAALRTIPDQPQIRETRGQIYLRLKQYREAIHDLEFALAANESPIDVHRSLAEAYDAIGLKDLAKSHAEIAQKSNPN